jgi:hypothetical protein
MASGTRALISENNIGHNARIHQGDVDITGHQGDISITGTQGGVQISGSYKSFCFTATMSVLMTLSSPLFSLSSGIKARLFAR